MYNDKVISKILAQIISMQKSNVIDPRLQSYSKVAVKELLDKYGRYINADELLKVLGNSSFRAESPASNGIFKKEPNILGYWQTYDSPLPMNILNEPFKGEIIINEDLPNNEIYNAFMHEFIHLATQRYGSIWDSNDRKYYRHCGLHVSAYNFQGGFSGEYGRGINEGLTEYFASKIRGQGIYYPFEFSMANLLHYGMGETVEESFFTPGKEYLAMEEFDRLSGTDEWRKLNDAMDTIINDSAKDAKDRLPSHEIDKLQLFCQDSITHYFGKRELKNILDGRYSPEKGYSGIGEYQKSIAKLESMLYKKSSKWQNARFHLNIDFINEVLGNQYSYKERLEHLTALEVVQEDCVKVYKQGKDPDKALCASFQSVPELGSEERSVILIRNSEGLRAYEAAKPSSKYYYSQIIFNQDLNTKEENDIDRNEKQIKTKVNNLFEKRRGVPRNLWRKITGKPDNNIEILTSNAFPEYVFVNNKEKEESHVFEIMQDKDKKDLQIIELQLSAKQKAADNAKPKSIFDMPGAKLIEHKNPEPSKNMILKPEKTRRPLLDIPPHVFETLER